MLEIPPTPPANCASCPGLQLVGVCPYHSIGAGQPGCTPYWELMSASYCSQLPGQNYAYCVHGLPGTGLPPLWESGQTLVWAVTKGKELLITDILSRL
ncbi:hypothetical protein DSO57_1027709 [Entomophthora muscae]|uniref:Uncharacterized protein n=1 Tax=Entomophthora muscae TaxID=34485 RepID=A0ACC2SES3_9FUNG|nr:hypothetical protein DSO57_1027709 [Entomophthora muscae]